MAIEGDKLVSLPAPPPRRSAARREAIDAALRKFDGVEEPIADRTPARRSGAGMDRRAFGALATAAVVALVAVPIALVTLRDISRPETPQLKTPYAEEAATDSSIASDNLAQGEPLDSATLADEAPSSQQPQATQQVADRRAPMAMTAEKPKIANEAPAPAATAAAPPPPPPPPAPARTEQYAAEPEAQDIVLTGSRVRSPEPAVRASRQAKAASPMVTMDAYGEFLSRLQKALEADNRRSVSGMVGFPLTVNVDGRVETYRSRREVESDFDRIFTPEVKAEILSQKPYSLRTRADGRTKGSQRIWFAPTCFNEECSSAGPVRIREVTP